MSRGEQIIKELKHVLTYFRHMWVCGKPPSTAAKGSKTDMDAIKLRRLFVTLFERFDPLQFSYVSRALPEGTLRVCDEALTQHKEDLMTEHNTPEFLLENAFTFAKSWSKRFSRPTDLRIGDDIMVSDSACWENTRAEGGGTKAK